MTEEQIIDKYAYNKPISDIIDSLENLFLPVRLSDEEMSKIRNKIRLAYFRGLSHCSNRENILNEALQHTVNTQPDVLREVSELVK